MTLQIGKLIRKTYETDNGEFHLYVLYCPGGKFETATYRGTDAPPPRKTVEYQLSGEWITHPRFGRQFEIHSYQKTGKPGHRGESRQMVTNIKRLKETPMTEQAAETKTRTEDYYDRDSEVILKEERDKFMEQVVDAVDRRIVTAADEVEDCPSDCMEELVREQIRGTAVDVLNVIDNGGSGKGYFLIEKTDDLRMMPASEKCYEEYKADGPVTIGLDLTEKGSLAQEMLDRIYPDDE